MKSVSLDVGLMVSLCKFLFRKLSISSRPWLTENGRRFFIFRRQKTPCKAKPMRDMESTPLHNNLTNKRNVTLATQDVEALC